MQYRGIFCFCLHHHHYHFANYRWHHPPHHPQDWQKCSGVCWALFLAADTKSPHSEKPSAPGTTHTTSVIDVFALAPIARLRFSSFNWFRLKRCHWVALDRFGMRGGLVLRWWGCSAALMSTADTQRWCTVYSLQLMLLSMLIKKKGTTVLGRLLLVKIASASLTSECSCLPACQWDYLTNNSDNVHWHITRQLDTQTIEK